MPSMSRVPILIKIIYKPIIWFIYLIGFLCLLWGSLAILYSEIPFQAIRIIFSLIYASFGIWALWLASKKRKRFAITIWLLMLAIFFLHWDRLEPTHDREWRADMKVMPRAYIDGDNVTITNYRNFEYRSLTDFTPHYEDRTIQLSHLTSIDFYISYWMPGPIAHTFLSFNFDNAPPVCISIEARFESHERFDPIASLFKEFELIYIVGDERDIVRVRTNFRKEDVYRYTLNVSPENARRLFLVYMERIKELSVQPEFYHLLSNNCTLNIVRYANRIGREGTWDFRLILNGWSDRYLYRAGHLDKSMPFDELRKNGLINEQAQAANDDPDFYLRIRNIPSSQPQTAQQQ